MMHHHKDISRLLSLRLAQTMGFLVLASGLLSVQSAETPFYQHKPTWSATMVSSRAALLSSTLSAREREAAAGRIWLRLHDDFPVQWDWVEQDAGPAAPEWFVADDVRPLEHKIILKAIEELGANAGPLQQESEKLLGKGSSHQGQATASAMSGASPTAQGLELYVRVCEQRRAQRLRTLLAEAPRIIFTKHRTIRPSFFAYTEGQSDAQNERHFLPGSELCLLEFDGLYGRSKTLLADPSGAIRDPAVSWNGKRVVFAWKKSLDEDDYHLYSLDPVTRETTQITSGLGFADYEPACLPNGDLIFASTRCVQTVDCWWTEVSNLYTCDASGRYLRRLTFDQVHSIHPDVMDDGRVIYTRWDYNDRGQIFPQPLFQMNPDGTGQTEFYGNNSWFPTTIAHARGIPGTQKALAILCGHHSSQAGKLAVIDPAKGRQENSGVQLVAPVRNTPAERIDSYGQEGELWQYPFPLNEREFIVTYAPLGWDQPNRRRGDADFALYWMDMDGRRELLISDPALPCSQPVPLRPRPTHPALANRVDYTRTNATVYLQDVYAGPGLEGVPRGTIRKLRVVALEFRAAGVRNNGSSGPGGGALISTPISIGNGAWDIKVVLGEVKVHEDGSALFTVPASTPLYFQALDERGFAVQTMRSWSTLQPGEYLSCVGCHEHKNSAPPSGDASTSLAMRAGPQPLAPFFGPARGFSFPKEVQPILDRHCVRCHKDREPVRQVASGQRQRAFSGKATQPQAQTGPSPSTAFSLLSDENVDESAGRKWSDAYLVLTQSHVGNVEGNGFSGDSAGPVVTWISSQSVPSPLPPYFAGAARSGLIRMLASNHQGVKLSAEELQKIGCWIDLGVPFCGDFLEANAWTEGEVQKYWHYAAKRLRMQELERQNIRDFLGRASGPVQ